MPKRGVTFVEGYLDKMLFTLLGFPKVNIKGNKGQVLNKIEKINVDFGIAIVDNDFQKNQPKLLNNYQQVEQKANVKLLKHKQKNVWCIIIIPFMEKWLYHKCPQLHKDIKYKNHDSLKLVSKSTTARYDKNIELLLNWLVEKEHRGIMQLQLFLNEIIGNC